MRTFNELKKNLKKDFTGHKKIKLAVLADSASQLMCTAIRGHGYEAQLDYEIYEADYNQIDLQLFDQSSELYEFRPEYIFINRATEKLFKDFYKKDKAGQEHFAEHIAEQYRRYHQAIAGRLKSKIIVNTFPEINDRVFGNFAAKTKNSFIYQLRKANVLLMELSQQVKDMFVCDLASLQAELGYYIVFDPKMYVNADMVYSIEFLPYIAKHITDIIQSISGSFRKCLILDLDNTTWGGIIGDDGMEGIQLGYFGSGKIFTELQHWAKQLKNRGIILAICSKNTENIAKEPFLSHPDMVLRLEDIAVFVANWETKVDNIRHIQSILNIGFDSMVFLDDNPFEREMVKSAIPELTVPDLPEDPAEYLMYLRSQNLFETASFTEEDEQRTRQYQEEAQRNVLQQSFENEHEFLGSLHMVSDVKAFDTFTIPRVAQLTQRSNQFNLRTVRYTDEDVKRIANDPDYFTMSLTLEDKFGDHGLIAVIILKKESATTLFIDTWIMSCRVLKRGMENFTLNAIAELAAFYNFEQVTGEYLPTKKNGIVKDHYSSLGFEQQGDKWVLNVAAYQEKETFITKK
ncbi:MAG: HAD-IIIC family phosphatase [Bacteroidota bacterium]